MFRMCAEKSVKVLLWTGLNWINLSLSRSENVDYQRFVNNSESNKFINTSEVPQGYKVRLLLFIMFINVKLFSIMTAI